MSNLVIKVQMKITANSLIHDDLIYNGTSAVQLKILAQAIGI